LKQGQHHENNSHFRPHHNDRIATHIFQQFVILCQTSQHEQFGLSFLFGATVTSTQLLTTQL